MRPALDAAIAGGFKVVEVTLTTPDCFDHIAARIGIRGWMRCSR